MTFTHQQPFHELEQIERQINQVFDELDEQSHSIHALGHLANIQIHQTPAMVKLTAVLPGINPAQLKVDVIDKSVLISGKFDETLVSKSLVRSQVMNPVRWVVALPTAVISHPIDLDYTNGILTVLLQKVEAI
jgi:HSP20 family molecular chaperone IbpA